MCNTYVCVLYHSSYMSSVTRMWISSIWLSKITPVDALKIPLTRSDFPSSEENFHSFSPRVHWYFNRFSSTCLLSKQASAQRLLGPQKSREKSPHEPNPGTKWVLQFTVGRSCCVHKGKRTLGGLNSKVRGVTSSQSLLLLLCLWHRGIFLLHKGRGKRGWDF